MNFALGAHGGESHLAKCEAVPRRARILCSRLVYHSTLGWRVIKKKKECMAEIECVSTLRRTGRVL